MSAQETVVIFQIGSLGDTVIAMPCYREIARRHPNARRFLLTNHAVGSKMVQAEALLQPCGLIEGTVEYPMPLRGAANIAKLYKTLRALRVDTLYYLMPERKLKNVIRHFSFLKLCGVRQVRALPWTADLRESRELVPGKLWETEGSRLLRTLLPKRQPGPPPEEDRALDLTEAEQHKADELLRAFNPSQRFLAFSIGGRIPVKDWGDANWSAVLDGLSTEQPELGIVFVGSRDEAARSDALGAHWRGPKLNACGRLTPRESAAVIARASLFLGHDTGTMHLAAAVDTRVLAIFCARNPPGIWYTDQPRDTFFYNQPPCFGCEIAEVQDCPHDMVCMTSHRREDVVAAALISLQSTDRSSAVSTRNAIPAETS